MLGVGVGGGTSDVEDDARVVGGGALSVDDTLIAQRVKCLGIAVAARGSVGTSGDQRRIGDGNGKARGRSRAGSRRRVEEIRAGVSVQVETSSLHGVDCVRKAGSEGIELSLNRGNLLIAGLKISAQLSGDDAGGDVHTLREDLLRTRCAKLAGELETLLAGDERCAAGGR